MVLLRLDLRSLMSWMDLGILTGSFSALSSTSRMTSGSGICNPLMLISILPNSLLWVGHYYLGASSTVFCRSNTFLQWLFMFLIFSWKYRTMFQTFLSAQVMHWAQYSISSVITFSMFFSLLSSFMWFTCCTRIRLLQQLYLSQRVIMVRQSLSSRVGGYSSTSLCWVGWGWGRGDVFASNNQCMQLLYSHPQFLFL